MTASAETGSFEGGDYLGVLRRRWWIVFGLVCLGTLAAAAYVVVAPKTYVATSSVYVDANAANANQLLNSRTTTAVNMDNETQIVQSSSVAARAAKLLHTGVSTQQLARRVSVTVPANTTVLQISCSARSATRAAACAQAFAKSYLASRQATAASKINSEIAELTAKATPLQADSVTLQHKIAALSSGSSQLAATHAKLATVASQLAPLRAAIASLGAATNVNAGYIITAAVPPSKASSPKTTLYLPSGLMAGLLIGLIAAFIADRRDDRIHAATDVERFLDLPVLLRPFQKKLSPPTPLFSQRSKPGRAFTELTRVIAATLGDGSHVLLVAGTAAGPSTSIVAANVAATLARTRSHVILVCAETSVSPRLFGVDAGRGLAEAIAGTATVSDVTRRAAEVAGLRVVTQGFYNAAALNSPQYDASRRVVTELKRDARYVVIEAEAVGDGADTFNLAEFADAALVVIEVGSSRQSEAADTIRLLDRMRTAVLGAAVLPASRGRSREVARPSSALQQPRAAQAMQAQSSAQTQRRPRTVDNPRRRALPGEPQRDGAARPAGHHPTETWPLARMPDSASDAGSSADKAAGGN